MTRDSKQRINETSSGPRDVARHEHSSRKCLPGSIHFTGVAAVETMNAMHAETRKSAFALFPSIFPPSPPPPPPVSYFANKFSNFEGPTRASHRDISPVGPLHSHPSARPSFYS